MPTGSIQKQSGRYFAVLNVYIDGKRKQRWIDTGLPVRGNKRKADEFLKKIRKEYEANENLAKTTEANAVLFADFLREWLEVTKHTIEYPTYASYLSMIDARIDKHFRDLGVTLAKVEPKHIRQLYDKILSDGHTPNTVIHYHAVIRKALQYAVKNELLARNVADLVDKPKKNHYQAQYYDKEELDALFAATADDVLGPLIQLTAFYGLRRSEVLGLRWSAIDFKRRTVSINHKVTERKVGGKTVVVAENKLKTKSSFRVLPLIPAMEKLLVDEKSKQQKYAKMFKSSYCKDYTDYVCVDPMGKLLHPNYVTAHFGVLIENLGLRKIRFHDLRHSCASLLLGEGVPMKVIQEWLGHSTFSTTADIYSHLDMSAKLGAAAAIGAALSGEADA